MYFRLLFIKLFIYQKLKIQNTEKTWFIKMSVMKMSWFKIDISLNIK